MAIRAGPPCGLSGVGVPRRLCCPGGPVPVWATQARAPHAPSQPAGRRACHRVSGSPGPTRATGGVRRLCTRWAASIAPVSRRCARGSTPCAARWVGRTGGNAPAVGVAGVGAPWGMRWGLAASQVSGRCTFSPVPCGSRCVASRASPASGEQRRHACGGQSSPGRSGPRAPVRPSAASRPGVPRRRPGAPGVPRGRGAQRPRGGEHSRRAPWCAPTGGAPLASRGAARLPAGAESGQTSQGCADGAARRGHRSPRHAGHPARSPRPRATAGRAGGRPGQASRRCVAGPGLAAGPAPARV